MLTKTVLTATALALAIGLGSASAGDRFTTLINADAKVMSVDELAAVVGTVNFAIFFDFPHHDLDIIEIASPGVGRPTFTDDDKVFMGIFAHAQPTPAPIGD